MQVPAQTLALTSTLAFSFAGIDQVDRMANIAGLGARMDLMTMIAGLHGGTVGPGRERIVFDIAMTIDAESFFLGMKLMGDLHNPDALQVGLFPPGDALVAAETVFIHQVITGEIVEGDDLSGLCVAIRTGNRCRMNAGREPHLGWILITVTT
jgi:hypothetical protein